MGLDQPWRSLLRIAFNYPLAFNYPESFLSAVIIYRMGVSDILVNSHLMTDTALKGAIQPGNLKGLAAVQYRLLTVIRAFIAAVSKCRRQLTFVFGFL